MAFAHSVLPTPVGPRNRNAASGRSGSLSRAFAMLTTSASRFHRFRLADDLRLQLVTHVVAVESLFRIEERKRKPAAGGEVGQYVVPLYFRARCEARQHPPPGPLPAGRGE